MKRSRGRIKFFDDKKGFGFVTSDEGGPDLFIHRTDLAFPGDHRFLTLIEGQRVTFETVETVRGPKAVGVNIEQQRVRGRASVFALVDEMAYWQGDDSASPDAETSTATTHEPPAPGAGA
jgi:CspA family cold shock protein